jgi:hypothetical protein
MEGVQHLPAHQQQAFMKEMEHMQLKDSLTYVCLSLDDRSLVLSDLSPASLLSRDSGDSQESCHCAFSLIFLSLVCVFCFSSSIAIAHRFALSSSPKRHAPTWRAPA